MNTSIKQLAIDSSTAAKGMKVWKCRNRNDDGDTFVAARTRDEARPLFESRGIINPYAAQLASRNDLERIAARALLAAQ